MRVLFGPFTLESESRRLLCGPEERHLTPKAFDLLELLVRERPAAVSKTRILETLWPSTFVVEANLSNLVAEVREALGDDARQPRFVRTVYGRGYAFADGAVETARTEDGAGASPEQPDDLRSAVRPSANRRSAALVVLGIVLALVAGIAARRWT